MVIFALYAAAALASVIVFERLFALIVVWFAPLLPDDLCGPDGWYVATDRKTGIFERTRSS